MHTTVHPTTQWAIPPQCHPTTHNSHTCIPMPNLTGIIVVHPFRINIATIHHHTMQLHTTCIITTLPNILNKFPPTIIGYVLIIYAYRELAARMRLFHITA